MTQHPYIHHLFHALRFLVFSQLVIGLMGTYSIVQRTNAAGGSESVPLNFKLTTNKSSIAANNSETATITITYYHYKCNNGDKVVVASNCDPAYYGGVDSIVSEPYVAVPSGKYKIATSGIAVTKSQTTIDGGNSDSFTIKGSKAGTVTVTVTDANTSDAYAIGLKNSVSISLKAVASVAPSPSPTPTPTPTPAPSPSPTPSPSSTTTEKETAPTAPKLSTIMAGDEQIAIKSGKFEVAADEEVVLSGKTIASAKVDIYIFSEEKHITTTSDKNGVWAYTLAASSLPPGDHHVEVAVTDPTTKLTSKRATVAQFTVTEPIVDTTPQLTPRSERSITPLVLLVGVSLFAAAVGATAGFVLHRKHKKAL